LLKISSCYEDFLFGGLKIGLKIGKYRKTQVEKPYLSFLCFLDSRTRKIA